MPDLDFDTITPSTPICVVTLAEYRSLMKNAILAQEETRRRVDAEHRFHQSEAECDRLRKRVSQLEALLPRPYTGPVDGDTILNQTGERGLVGIRGIPGTDLMDLKKARNPHD